MIRLYWTVCLVGSASGMVIESDSPDQLTSVALTQLRTYKFSIFSRFRHGRFLYSTMSYVGVTSRLMGY